MNGRTGVARPRTVDEVTAATRGLDGRIAYVAGATDLIIAQDGIPWPDLVIDITQVAGFNTVEVSRGFIRIGAATTMTTLSNHKTIGTEMMALARAAAKVGSVQIRNRATIGGNIASAMPAGDLLPALHCLGARIGILRRDGLHETLGFEAVVVGRGETCLGNGDLITTIYLPRETPKRRISAFVKTGPREVLTIARLGVAASIRLNPKLNRVEDARVVAGALAPVPLRMHQVEATLRDREIGQPLADDFLFALSQAVDAAIPGRHSQPYKRRAITGLGLDLLQQLFNREFDIPSVQAEPA
ncbi:MAG: molybdopterin dehydrogenase [Rhodobacteraceae bacterium]|nr:molybdopterin dehydrogenase [Paracoccaceae bacterium]